MCCVLLCAPTPTPIGLAPIRRLHQEEVRGAQGGAQGLAGQAGHPGGGLPAEA
jgi:hypothetical protein